MAGKACGEAATPCLLRTDAGAPVLPGLAPLFATLLPGISPFLSSLLRGVAALLASFLCGIAAFLPPLLCRLPALLSGLPGIVLSRVLAASIGSGIFAPVLPGLMRSCAPLLS